MAKFPLGINPSMPLPGSGRVHVEVENHGGMGFNEPTESVVSLAIQVMAMYGGKSVMVENTENYLTVLEWNPESRRLKVKIN